MCCLSLELSHLGRLARLASEFWGMALLLFAIPGQRWFRGRGRGFVTGRKLIRYFLLFDNSGRHRDSAGTRQDAGGKDGGGKDGGWDVVNPAHSPRVERSWGKRGENAVGAQRVWSDAPSSVGREFGKRTVVEALVRFWLAWLSHHN